MNPISGKQPYGTAKLHELGDVQCQFIAGRLFSLGTGVPVNFREAAKWFLRAAEHGHAAAAHNIAVYFAKGTGVERDIEKARAWFSVAAEKGISAAQIQLGKLYAIGDGVPRDKTLAIEWLKKAIASGDPEAKTVLALLHLDGGTAAADSAAAEELLRQAAESGHAPAATQLGHLYSGRYKVLAGKGDPIFWYKKAADAENVDAQFALGLLLLNGRGVLKDAKAAALLFEKAAHKDHAAAQFELAVLYCTGQGVQKIWSRVLSGMSSQPSMAIGLRNTISESCWRRAKDASQTKPKRYCGFVRPHPRASRRQTLLLATWRPLRPKPKTGPAHRPTKRSQMPTGRPHQLTRAPLTRARTRTIQLLIARSTVSIRCQRRPDTISPVPHRRLRHHCRLSAPQRPMLLEEKCRLIARCQASTDRKPSQLLRQRKSPSRCRQHCHHPYRMKQRTSRRRPRSAAMALQHQPPPLIPRDQ